MAARSRRSNPAYYNATLERARTPPASQTIRVNTFALVNEIIANPAAYGFANVTAPRAARPAR